MQLAFPANEFCGFHFPATHAAHGPPFGPVYPALQKQLVKALLNVSAKEFDGQAMHVELAVAPTCEE
jgi:hypothetical protein